MGAPLVAKYPPFLKAVNYNSDHTLCRCADGFESLLYAHANLYLMVITGSNLIAHSLVYLDYNLSQDMELFLSGNTSCIFNACHAVYFYPLHSSSSLSC